MQSSSSSYAHCTNTNIISLRKTLVVVVQNNAFSFLIIVPAAADAAGGFSSIMSYT